MRYEWYCVVWSKYPIDLEIAKSMLEAEARSVQDRYGFKESNSEEPVIFRNLEETDLINNTQVNAIRAKCRDLRISSFDETAFEE